MSRVLLFAFSFFFSSRRRHTRWPRDWSSDVCSSDLFRRQVPLFSVWFFFNFVQSLIRDGDVVQFDGVIAWCGGNVEQIGRASCRERVWVSGVAGALEKRRWVCGEGRRMVWRGGVRES